MKNKSDLLSRETFKAGKKVFLVKENLLGLPVKLEDLENTEVLFISSDEGYRIIPLKADVKKLYIEVTTLCNFDCITCIRNSWNDDLSQMTLETFEKIVKSLPGLPELECVHFGGFGEPFSHPKIFDMLGAVKEAGLKAEVITNGSLLTIEAIDKLIDLKVDMVYVSMDAPDPEEYDRIRQGGNFTSVLANVTALINRKKELKSKFPEMGMEFVAMKSNYHKLPQLVRVANDLKVRKLIVTNLLPYHESMQDQIVYDIDDTETPFGSNSPLSMLMAQLPYMKLRTDRHCKFVEDKAMCVNHKGYVSPCYALMHSYSCFIYGRKKDIIPYYLGNVNEKELAEIWKETQYVNFRLAIKDFKFPSCPDCKYLEGVTSLILCRGRETHQPAGVKQPLAGAGNGGQLNLH